RPSGWPDRSPRRFPGHQLPPTWCGTTSATDRSRLARRGKMRKWSAYAQEAIIMTLGRLRLSVADARDLAEGALRGIGYHDDGARIIADHVIDAPMCGHEYCRLAKILNVFEREYFRLPRRSKVVFRETEVSLA